MRAVPRPKRKTSTRKKASASDKINNIYQGLIDRLEKIEKFTLEQAPDICKEIVELKVVETQNRMVVNVVSLMGTIPFFVAIYLAITLVAMNPDLTGEPVGLAYILSAVVGLIASMALFINISCLVDNFLKLREIKVSQKLIILRTLKRLVS